MKFSITIPAYKSQFLNEAIRSVIAQTFGDWELIIVDDCSPEHLRAIAEPYLYDSRIHYYRNEKNCGAVNVVDNWNTCLSYTAGDYVICMGDDDLLLPCCLEEYKKLIDKYPLLNVYHARTQIIDDKGSIINLQGPRPEWESVLSLLWNRWDNRHRQFLGDFCYRTDYLKAAGGYYKQPLAWGSDDITAALAAKGNGIANSQCFCFQYRENAMTISKSSRNAHLKVEATLAHYCWFTNFIKELSIGDSTSNDQFYKQTIETPRRKFFISIIGIYCSESMRANPMKLFRYRKLLKNMQIPTVHFVKWYLESFYYLFVK